MTRRSLDLSDAALTFMKSTRVDQTIRPCTMTSTVYNLVVELGNAVADSAPDTDYESAVDDLVGLTLSEMSIFEILSELHSVFIFDDTTFSTPVTDQAPDGAWTVRGRVADVLADVYRDLLMRLVVVYRSLPTDTEEPRS